MSLNKYATPLRLEPHISRILLILLLFAHGGALLLCLLPDFSPVIRLVIILFVALSLLFVFRRFYSENTFKQLVWDEQGVWVLCRHDGRQLDAELLPDSYVSPGLVILNLRCLDGTRCPSQLLLSDSLDEETFRRLRVRLRLEGAAPESGVEPVMDRSKK
ncbi:MAG: hypothetical protein KAJ19_03980 [Gammaproteobacteria bacterium]|nr:hypothetical protein [Gammaproteobacteria bacterium]